MRPALVPLLALVAAAPAGAMDLLAPDRVRDLRAVFGFSPSEYEADGQAVDTGVPLRFGLQYMGQIGMATERGRFIAGGELSYTIANGDVLSVEIDITTTALTVFGGWAYTWPTREQMHFEGTLFLGLGQTAWEGDGQDEDDGYWEFGPRVAGFYTLMSGWQIGADIRYLVSEADQLENNGPAALVTGGRRF